MTTVPLLYFIARIAKDYGGIRESLIDKYPALDYNAIKGVAALGKLIAFLF